MEIAEVSFLFCSFNLCDASRAAWKRDLNPLTAKVHDGVFFSMWTKSCGITNQMKPLQW